MYCPVYGCSSDSQAATETHFFRFPAGKSLSQQTRRKTWIEFCKRKGFQPTSCTRICSLHFADDAYEPGKSPEFLKRLEYRETFRVRLKNDALPTLNKPLETQSSEPGKKRRHSARRQRKKAVGDLLKRTYSDEEKDEKQGSEDEIDDDVVDDPDVPPIPLDTRPSTSYSQTAVSEEIEFEVRTRSTQTTQKKRSVKSQTLLDCKSSLFKVKELGISIGTQTQSCEVSNNHALPAEISSETSSSSTELHMRSDELDRVSKSSEIFSEEATSTESDDDIGLIDNGTVLKEGKSPEDQIKLIVFEEAIMDIFGTCTNCGSRCTVLIKSQIGSSCTIAVSCTRNSIHYYEWKTGPRINHMPVFHLLFASGILTTGLETAKVIRLFNALKIPNIQHRQVFQIMKSYVVPTVYIVWKNEQSERLKAVQGGNVVIASDMRVDSPGHSGLFGSGSSLDMEHNVILDTQVIKSTEVKSSNAMELESLKRQLNYLKDNKVKVKKLVTDRHVQVSAYMAKDQQNIEHAYDVWHVAKGEKKKLTKLVKKKKFQSIKPWIGSIVNHIYWVGASSETADEKEEKWKSIVNHIVNIHRHEDHKIFVECLHGTIERAWLKKGSASHKMLTTMLTRPRLITAIRKLSQYHQTSGLEAKHALDNLFASKNIYHSYHSLTARLYCSNLHYNENSSRNQARTADGKLRWAIAYPKAFKGEKAVAKPLKETPTYG